LIGFIHSLFISIPSRVPVYYSGAIATVLIALYLVYRLHLGFTDKDLRAAILTSLTAAITFLVCAVIFYAAPALKWIYNRAISPTKNA
jgi:heme/copper-type cytochrome/quinol oxidase subunit 4